MSMALLVAATKLQAIYMVYGSRNLLFWASVANSTCICALMVDAVAFNSGPFKMLRGNIAHDAVPKGLLPPLRTRTGAVVSFVGMLRWAFYGGHDRTSVMTSFMINPSSGTLVDDEDHEEEETSRKAGIVYCRHCLGRQVLAPCCCDTARATVSAQT